MSDSWVYQGPVEEIPVGLRALVLFLLGRVVLFLPAYIFGQHQVVTRILVLKFEILCIRRSEAAQFLFWPFVNFWGLFWQGGGSFGAVLVLYNWLTLTGG